VAAEDLADLDEETRCQHIANRLVERVVPAVTLFDPDRVMVEASFLGPVASRFLQRFQASLRAALRGELPKLPPVGLAKAGELGVALGAMLAARKELIKRPERLLDGERR